jgi:hypothetical protein
MKTAEFVNENSSNTSERSFIGERSRLNSHSTKIKALVSDALGCALAHWYFLPGLQLQRYRLRLAFSLAQMSEEIRRELEILPAYSYLDCDFALRSLRAQHQLGSYLDVSSPWLLPLYVLKAFQAKPVVLLNTSSTTRRLFESLANSMRLTHTAIATKELGHLSGLSESFDTITCLARLSADEKQRALLNSLWKALNPGGTLIVSLVCKGTASTAAAGIDGLSDTQSATETAFAYDSDLLKSHVFHALGEPRNYAIYGKDAALAHGNLVSAASQNSGWRESLAVGKHWRRYSSISQVHGQGILALKFVKAGDVAVFKAVS